MSVLAAVVVEAVVEMVSTKLLAEAKVFVLVMPHLLRAQQPAFAVS